MLCVQLWVEGQCLGALSLYAQESNPFNEHHIRLTRLFATHAAPALPTPTGLSTFGSPS